MDKKFATEKELIIYAEKIINKKVSDIFTNEQIRSFNVSGKGKIGQLVEKYYFGYDLNNNKEPDFKNLGIELKVTPLNQLKNKSFSPKERLVLSMVSHDDLINNEVITDSELWLKIRKMLIIWYVYSPDFRENKFTLMKLLKLEEDEKLSQIKDDWAKIRKLLIEGRATEFSESKTKYLGVVRKGSGGESDLIKQPYSNEKYYKRAFSLKTKYIKEVLNDLIAKSEDNDYIQFMKSKLVGKKLKNIMPDKYKNSEKLPKNIAAICAANVLGEKNFSSMTEKYQEKFGEYVTFKTVPLTYDSNGEHTIKEHFKINTPISEQAIKYKWEDSLFSQIFESKFICIIYEFNKDMKESMIKDIREFSFEDKNISFVINAYNEFSDRYENGTLVDKKNGNVNFIKPKDKKGVHFRPWAANKKHTFTTPMGEVGTKTGLWLNKDLVFKLLYEK